MADGGAELERLHLPVGEQLHLLVPVFDSPPPVVVAEPLALFVDVEILSNAEPVNLPAVGAVMGKLALVRVSLCHSSQLIVPGHFPHIASSRLWSRSSPLLLAPRDGGPELVVNVQHLLHLVLGQTSRQGLAARGTHTLILTHRVFPCYTTVVSL